MTAFWLIAVVLALSAGAILFLPTLRRRGAGEGWSVAGVAAAVVVPLAAIGIYAAVTNWDPAATERSSEDWAAIGRERFLAEDYYGARLAYIAAYERTPVPTNALKMSLAESLIITQPDTLLGAAGMLVEEVLAAEPTNVNALFYGALAATQRGELANARERFTRMLAADLPPDIENLVQRQIAAITAAEAGASGVAAAESGDGTQPDAAAKTVRVRVKLGEGRSLPTLGPEARLFISARSPQGGPPVAARQLAPSEIPGEVVLSDADSAMAQLTGARLSGESEVRVRALLSSNGDPSGQAGDLVSDYVAAQVGSDETVELVLDRTL